MFQLYSKGCEYTIKALIQMKDSTQNYGAKDICRRARVPESFSRKIFQSLVRGKFLQAVPGPGGGYKLCKRPNEISILDVIQAVDGPSAFDQCIMSLSKCSEKHACLLHQSWLKVKEPLLHELQKKKLQDLMKNHNGNALKRLEKIHRGD